jgi:phosphoribosyl 1,2-cyclic phosphodiesterase
MITFHPYASGSSGNLYTVSDGDTTVMLECGLPWRKVRELLNFKTSEIGGVVLTHSHLDHCKGAKDAARAGMDIYASRETLDALDIPGHRRHEVSESAFTIGTWIVIPFATVHDVEGSLGFYMGSQGERFLYLTDSAYSPVKFKDLSVIAVECNFVEDKLSENIQSGAIPKVVGRRTRRTHFSLETLIEFLKANDLSRCRRIYLLHLSDANSDERRMIRDVQEATGIPTEAC